MKQLKIITCSGANEFTDITGMVVLSEEYPLIEWGIQVSGKKCSFGSSRLGWIYKLQQYLQEKGQIINLALHVNADWVEDFCTGRLSPELNTLLRLRNVSENPLFQRVQLNFKIGREKTPDEKLLVMRIQQYGKDRRFIFSYNEENKNLIHHLYKNGLRDFDVLFDASHGEGILAEEWQAPAFYDEDIFQGYAGGLSPENITEEISKIRKNLSYNRSFYVDAEGKLKGEDRHLSLDRCEQYVANALQAMI